MTTFTPHAANGPLSQLRDIHVPGPVAAWPPAPGWFILAGLALVTVCGVSWWLYRRWRSNRYRREALAELQELLNIYRKTDDPYAYLVQYATLLKRIALTHYRRDAIAHLTGEAWVGFLDKSANTEEFSMGAGQALIEANYRTADSTDIDIQALHDLGKYWIKRHRTRSMEAVA